MYQSVYTINYMSILRVPLEFDWDEANQSKNWINHEVTREEIEEAFSDDYSQIYPDPAHSTTEVRKVIVGSTKLGRLLFIVFTLREEKVRVISARDLNKRKESNLYEKTPYSPPL